MSSLRSDDPFVSAFLIPKPRISSIQSKQDLKESSKARNSPRPNGSSAIESSQSFEEQEEHVEILCNEAQVMSGYVVFKQEPEENEFIPENKLSPSPRKEVPKLDDWRDSNYWSKPEQVRHAIDVRKRRQGHTEFWYKL